MLYHLVVSHRSFVLMQDLIVLRHGHAENNRCHILKAMYPFLTLRSLAAHIKQSVEKLITLVNCIK